MNALDSLVQSALRGLGKLLAAWGRFFIKRGWIGRLV